MTEKFAAGSASLEQERRKNELETAILRRVIAELKRQRDVLALALEQAYAGQGRDLWAPEELGCEDPRPEARVKEQAIDLPP